MVVAIDGPAASGKSTTAKRVAKELGFTYLDTGAMYRAITWAFLRKDYPISEEGARRLFENVDFKLEPEGDSLRLFIDGEDVTGKIRSEGVSREVSAVSALPLVRTRMVAEQRRFARRFPDNKGVVIDGRDIGTVVFPDADLKVFMVAEPEARARRRYEELVKRGEDVEYGHVLRGIMQRDRLDSERAHSPLRMAEDAVELDTTPLTIDEQVRAVVRLIRERRTRNPV